MKKALSLVLALAMLLSLATVAMAWNSPLLEDEIPQYAVDNIKENMVLVETNDGENVIPIGEREDWPTPYGEAYYFPLLNEENTPLLPAWMNEKSVSGLKVTPKWDQGGDYVESVEIVREKLGNIGESLWFVKLVIKPGTTETVDLAGKIYIKGTTGTDDNKTKIDKFFTVDLTLEYLTEKYDEQDEDDVYVPQIDWVWGDKFMLDLEDYTEDEATVHFLAENEEDDVAVAETDLSSTKKLLTAFDVKENADIVAAYPKADLDFVNLNTNFRKSADVTIYADEGSYLYKVVDGKLAKMDAEYDEWEEGFTFTAKALGSYVISNMELDLTVDIAAVKTENPTTGAAL